MASVISGVLPGGVVRIQLMKRKMKWKPYEVGSIVSGVTILKCLSTGTQVQTRYRIRYLCCGTETVTTHKSLMKREYDKTTMCLPCGRKWSGIKRRGIKPAKRKPEILKLFYHGWEPPPSAITRGRSV